MSGKKTKIGLTEVKYLGYICNREGKHMNPDKIKAVQEWPRPLNAHQLRQFLGLTGYLRRFIKNYANIAHPLTQQQSGPKEKPILWDEKSINAFQQLEQSLRIQIKHSPTLTFQSMPNLSLLKRIHQN